MQRVLTIGFMLAFGAGLPAAALAAPIQVDFNTAAFGGPASGSTSTFTKTNAVGHVNFTFDAYEDSVDPFAVSALPMLHWDDCDEFGYADGFGVIGSGYSGDEIEGNERLRLTFSEAVHLYGFNLTDFFDEREPNDLDCVPGTELCYQERGAFMLLFGDGTSSDWTWFTALPGALRTTNGLFDVPLDASNVIGLVFRSLGQVDSGLPSPFQELHEFSLAGVRIGFDPPTVPEPTTISLLALGLGGLAAARRKKREAAQQ